MYDKALVTFIFQQIKSSLFTISHRFGRIRTFFNYEYTVFVIINRN